MRMPEPIKLGFNQPFYRAVEELKKRGVVLPDKYYGELQGLHRQLNFSIAGKASLDQLQAVLDSLEEAMNKGKTFHEWKKDVRVQDLGLPKHRLDNIFRTNIQAAYNRGHWEKFVEHQKIRPYLMYDAINDSRVRPSHLAMDGIIRPVGDSFWAAHYPPNGYRCRCRCISLSERQAQERSKNGAGLNKQVTPEMNPDKGWDYNVGQDLTAGIEKSFNEKYAKLAPKLQNAADKTMLKAWEGANIAKKIPVTDLATLQDALTEYAKIFPEHLPHGVKGVFAAKETDDFFMATDGKGIFWFSEIETREGFNSHKDLTGAFSAIKHSEIMTQHQEYALETLWHEICHNRQAGIDGMLKLSQRNPRRIMAEMLNQYVSRLSYGGFVECLGGLAIHKEWVLKNGYGYQSHVRNFQSLLTALGANEAVRGGLFNVNFNEDLLAVDRFIAKAIAKNSGHDEKAIANLLFLMLTDDERFNRALNELNPI